MVMERARQRPAPAAGDEAQSPAQAGDGDVTGTPDAAGGARSPSAPAATPAPEPTPAPTPATPASDARPAADGAAATPSREQRLADAIKSGNAAEIAALVTEAGEVATVAEKLGAEQLAALVTLATGPQAALWRRPAIATVVRQGKPLTGLVGTAEGKRDAIAEALSQSKVADLVGSGIIAGDGWVAALDDAQYTKLVGLVAQPVTSQVCFDAIWRLYGDGTTRSAECARLTWKALFTARILPVGSTEAWSGGGHTTEAGNEFDWRWIYEPVAPNDTAMKRFMFGVRALPQGHVNAANIAFAAQSTVYYKRTNPDPSPDWVRRPSAGVSNVSTSYYLGTSNTIVMGVDAAGSPARLDVAMPKTSDGTAAGVGGATGPGAPALTYFLNHARHEIGHAVGNRMYQGMTEKGDDFALAWGGWASVSREGFASAMWNATGDVKLTFPGDAEKSFDASDVRDWLVGLVADMVEPGGNKVTRASGAIAAKLDVIKASSLGAQSLCGYVVAVFEASGKDVRRLQDRGFRQPGFTPPDPVHIWASRESPKGFWSFSKAAHDQLKATHGWYSMSSHKEMFAEIYTMKYSGGGLPGPVNGKDPAEFFRQLEASTDSALMPSGAAAGSGDAPSAKSGPGGSAPSGGTPAPATTGQAPTKDPTISNPAQPLGG